MKKITFLIIFAALGLFAQAISPDPLTLSNWETGTTTQPTYVWTNTKSVIVDPLNGSNHILQLDRDPTGATYLGVQWTNTVEPFKTNGVALGNTSASQYKYIVVKAKKSTSYDMKIKLELPQSGTNIVTLTSLISSQQGQWTYYVFDAGLVNVTHKQFSIFPEFGGNTGAVTTYFDEIYFANTLPTIDFSTYKFPLTYSTGALSATVTKTYDIARSGTNIDITLLSSQLIPGATSYNVYDGSNKLTTTYDAAKYVIKITGLTRSTNYNLQITAVNASNVESSKSEIIQFNTRSNTGTGYEVADDFEGGNLGWTTYGGPTINATAANPLVNSTNGSSKCLSFAVTALSTNVAMAILPNEKILAGATYANYQYLHVKMRRPSAAAVTTANIVLKLEKGGGQASGVSQEIPTISTVYNDDVWHDYVFDLKAAGVTNEPYYRQFDLMPNKLASGTQPSSFTMYIDDIYLSNDATLSTANISTVNIPVTITTSGSIATTTGARGYLSGDLAVVTATPNTNYRFTNWTLGSAGGAVQSTSSTYSFTVSSSTSLFANSIQTWSYTATSSDVTKGTVSGTGVYDAGASVTLIATPTTGYRFVNWADGSTGGASASTAASYTFASGTAHKSYFANFLQQFIVSASAGTGGSITSGAGTYDSGATATVVATADAGYRFVNWTLNTSGGAVQSPLASYSFTVSSAKTLVANFVSISTDNFRSKAAGNWGDIATWQSSPDNTSWYDVNAIPTSSAASVNILSGHEITVAANATSSALTINSGGRLNLNLGYTLGVTGNFNINSDNTNGAGTFVDKTTNAGLTVSGTTTVTQSLNAARNWYIGSPIYNVTAPSGYTYYKYHEAGDNTNLTAQYTTAYWENIGATPTLVRGTGYIANLSSGTATYSLAGTLNTGDVPLTLSRSGALLPGFNLVGNPYPSFLDISSLVDNTNLVPTYWVRSKAGSYVFDTYNIPGGMSTGLSGLSVTSKIAPMQAFWLRVKSGSSSASVTFTNAMRAHQDDTNNKFRAPGANAVAQQVLRLQVSNGIATDETVLYTNTHASNDFDVYDSQKMSNSSISIPEIYTVAGGEQLTINGLNSIPFDTELAIGFTTGQSNTFSMKASQFSNFDAGTKIILKDYLDLNSPVITDLSDGNSYSFTSAVTSNNTSRFTLSFKAPSVSTGINPENNENVWISSRNGQLMINANTDVETSLAVYNAVGQKIISKNLTKSNAKLGVLLRAGVYMVTVTNAGKSITQKVIID